jgi:uncharacterized membrane protein YfcA
MLLLFIYLLTGVITGILAGLLGLGGGLVIVPMLLACFSHENFDHALFMHIAIGTSLASIIFTSLSSSWAHHKQHAVHWIAVQRVIPGILVGTWCGSYVAATLSTWLLKCFFAIFLYCVAAQMLLDQKPDPAREMPGWLGMSVVGTAIGVISSLVGIGGGSMMMPFLLWCNLPPARAIGTSAAVGFPIAVFGAFGYIWHGWQTPGLPPYSLGYVYVPALLCIVCASMLTAPLGANLAHRLPVTLLKRLFALLLLVLAIRMTWQLW